AVTEPHLVWPSSTRTELPKCSNAYSVLASTNGPAIFAAARTTNRSPKVWSKTDSGGTRLSEQLSTVAFGCCDFVSDSRTLTTARGFSLPATKRLLPSIRSDQILSGDCAGRASCP